MLDSLLMAASSPMGVMLLAVLLLGLCVGLGLWALRLRAALRVAEARGSRASRARNARALDGEAEAEALLRAHGFTVLERQATVEAKMWVDGEEHPYSVRIDLRVRRGGRLYVAEVKTGDRAPDPTHGPTRRQLLEYALLLPDHDLLLVDMESERIIDVAFD